MAKPTKNLKVGDTIGHSDGSGGVVPHLHYTIIKPRKDNENKVKYNLVDPVNHFNVDQK